MRACSTQKTSKSPLDTYNPILIVEWLDQLGTRSLTPATRVFNAGPNAPFYNRVQEREMDEGDSEDVWAIDFEMPLTQRRGMVYFLKGAGNTSPSGAQQHNTRMGTRFGITAADPRANATQRRETMSCDFQICL